MRLKEHPNAIPGVLPDLEYMTKYLVPDPRGSAHVFWRAGRSNHGHDKDGLATLKWVRKTRARARPNTAGTYVVVRALLEHQKTPLEPHENACGLSQCVNVAHWRARPRLPAHQLVYVAGAWTVVAARTGRAIAEPLAVRVRTLDGVVHTARALPHGGIVPLCGGPLDLATTLVVDAPATCERGC